MASFKRIESLAERLRQSASVKTVYGESISAGDQTIVPVASVGYGFGGSGDENSSGVGGGVGATPVGVVEITPDGTRCIRFAESRRVGVALVVGFLLGVLLKRRK
ncbi:GerW family sporulation protein [Haladaptatus cibarius]|uniref:GerW family sporulation protein n=1 Tax=Haladaptatus cibarius TaxID=453847 RepID=UPI00067945E9|nr:spore germination protein GerW family protein [Haladaptatus cibarius]